MNALQVSTPKAHSARNHRMCLHISLVAIVPITCLIVCIYLWATFSSLSSEHEDMGYISAVYYSNWSVYKNQHFPQDVNVTQLSHVFYAFMKADEKLGKVKLSDTWSDTELAMGGEHGCLKKWNQIKKKHRHLKFIMSVGGWGTHQSFQQTVKSEARMANFVESIVELVETYKFDGVDIDWEYPSSPEEGKKLCELLEWLRLALDSIRSNLSLSVAAPGSTHHLRNFDIRRMDAVLSFWNVMCYDFAGSSWSEKTGYHLNLYGANGDTSLNADEILIHYIRGGVHPQKLVMGMPLYGRSFYSPSRANIGSHFNKKLPLPTDIVDYRDIPYDNEEYDRAKVAAYTYDDEQEILITYDNPQSVAEKAKYVERLNLRGGFWWDLKGESDEAERQLITKFVDQLGGVGELDHTTNWV